MAENIENSDCLNQAVQWYHDCVRKHELCRGPGLQDNWIPTRLLYVGSSSDPKLHLVDGSDIAPQPNQEYISLSHCWGGAVFLKLVRSNLGSMKREVPLEELSKTFRDAIKVARHFGICYIWIDSLCIIQDSRSDWLTESGLMDKVFTHSTFTLAATAARSGSDGLFRARASIAVEPCMFHARWKGKRRSFRAFDPDLWERGITDTPLNSRGWVLQEIALPVRILHFGAEQLFWECDGLCANETFPGGIPGGVRVPRMPRGWRRSLTGASGRREMLQLWHDVLSAYSRRRLTVESDKLFAIAGLAKYFEARTHGMFGTDGDGYCAGLWKSAMPSELLWRTTFYPPRTFSRPKDYRAPSWSFASLDGPVEGSNWAVTSKSRVMVEDVVLVSAGGYLMKEPKELPISLRGLLIPGSVELVEDDKLKETIALADMVAKQPLFAKLYDHAEGTGDHTSARALLENAFVSLDIKYEQSDTKDGEGKAEDEYVYTSAPRCYKVWLLPILLDTEKEGQKVAFSGLMLERIGEKDQYKRTGVFKANMTGPPSLRRDSQIGAISPAELISGRNTNTDYATIKLV